MSNYWDSRFLRHLDVINTIMEVGARYGDESIKLSQLFSNASIYSFECNPLTKEISRKKLENIKNVSFFDYGLGDKNESLPFYSYIRGNDGCSSFLKRIDFKQTQKQTGIITLKKLKDFVDENNIENIDLLCMDVQGYELNILKGAEEYIKKIKFIIMEEPNQIININELPQGLYSKYINAPNPPEIKEFMLKNNFTEIERVKENEIEDNVMYKNNLI